LLDTDHPRKLQVFNNFLDFGSYPAISDEALSVEEKKDWLRNYVRTYLERDIRDLAELRQLEPFTKVQKLIAINTAQLTNYSKIAAEAGVSLKTVQRFIEYMSISYQTLVLQSWSRNSSKRLSKSPKVHYLDVGVMRAVLQKNDKLSGHEFESAIVSEIFKQAKQSMSDLSFYHLRTSDGREVDLLIELEHGYIAIEIKQSSFVRNEDAKHLKGLETILDKPVLYKYVLSNDLSYKDLGDGVIGMPAVQFLM
jgi:predicted AAA+ superfamily ATPase